MLEITTDGRKMFLTAYDMQVPEKQTLILMLEEAFRLMDNEENYQRLIQMLDIDEGELLINEKLALES